MVSCSGIVRGDLWAKIFRIFFLTPYIYTAHLAQKNGLPPVGCLEGFGVAS
jgi:hypothetical protein